MLQLRLAGPGLNPAAPLTAEAKLPGVVNYYLGGDPKKWRAGIPTYARVRCAGVYPGVDLAYYGDRQGRRGV